MKKIFIFISLITLLGSGCVEEQRPCLEGHNETKHRAAYIIYMYTGKMYFPSYHPAIDYEVFVCDRFAPPPIINTNTTN